LTSGQTAGGAGRVTVQEAVEEAPERVNVVLEAELGGVGGKVRDDAFAVGGSPRVVINGENGRVVIRSGGDGEVRVQAELKDASRIDYQASQEGDTVVVEAKARGRATVFGLLGRHSGADIAVTTPRNTRVEVKNANGRVELYDIDGSGALETTNGRILMERLKGDFEAATRNARIEVRGIEGSTRLRTSNGRITIEDSKGAFDAVTSNASVHFAGEMTPGGKNRLETTNGSVQVKLNGAPSVKVDASTTNGRISRHGLRMAYEDTADSGRVVGTIGGGEAELVLRTSNASITLEQGG
ncbi:MAG: DUF4097 family beta strand repeat-containing protein, partial [Ardenticatenaceae bacterium]